MLKKIYITVLAVVLIAGCKKDPKNVGPTNAFSAGNYPKTINDLQTILVSAYANLRDQNLYGFTLLTKNLSNSTHAVNSVWTGDLAWNEMANTNLTTSNSYVGGVWVGLYAGVKACNVTLYAANQYLTNNHNAPAADKQTINLVLGQAYCLRGWYYMELECLYGEKYMTAGGTNGDAQGIPIIDALPTTLAATQVARSSVKDTWAFIINDFKQAQSLLKGQVWGAADAARVTEWSAEGLLGKAYVYTQDWADAKTVLLDLIQKSGKTLMPYAIYHDAFNGLNKFNSESLFELYIDPNTKGGYGVYGNANSAANAGLIWSPVTFGGYNSDGTPFDGIETQKLGYSNEFFHDKNLARFGFNLGSTFNLVPNPKFVPPATFFNPAQIMDPVYMQQSLTARTNNTTDPRLFINALQPYVDSVQFDGIHWGKVAKVGEIAGNPNVYGWSIKKYSPINYNEGTGQGNPSGINTTADAWDYYILRLADVYLLYAEACINSGDNTDGLEYINKVHRRAYNLQINAPSPTTDYASITAKTMAPDAVLGHNPLYYERWAELFNEGSWWFDVCRWRIGATEAVFYVTAVNVNGSFNWVDSKSYVWPIPQSEINSNAKIKQSSGY